MVNGNDQLRSDHNHPSLFVNLVLFASADIVTKMWFRWRNQGVSMTRYDILRKALDVSWKYKYQVAFQFFIYLIFLDMMILWQILIFCTVSIGQHSKRWTYRKRFTFTSFEQSDTTYIIYEHKQLLLSTDPNRMTSFYVRNPLVRAHIDILMRLLKYVIRLNEYHPKTIKTMPLLPQ